MRKPSWGTGDHVQRKWRITNGGMKETEEELSHDAGEKEAYVFTRNIGLIGGVSYSLSAPWWKKLVTSCGMAKSNLSIYASSVPIKKKMQCDRFIRLREI